MQLLTSIPTLVCYGSNMQCRCCPFHRPSHFLNFASLEDSEIAAELTEKENFFD